MCVFIHGGCDRTLNVRQHVAVAHTKGVRQHHLHRTTNHTQHHRVVCIYVDTNVSVCV